MMQRMMLTIRESIDKRMRTTGVTLRTGRKWPLTQAIDTATSRLKHRDLVGKVSRGRQGLVFGSREGNQRWDRASATEKRGMVTDELRGIEEEMRRTKAVAMATQGAWQKWESTVNRKVTWSEMWKMETMRIRFMISATYDVLPTPTNLVKWGMTASPKCSQCDKPANLEHILSACKIALSQERSRWRHDQVLKELAHHIERKRVQSKQKCVPKTQQIKFVKASENKMRTSIEDLNLG